MRRLLLLRHAKAERTVPGAADQERNLVERGRSDAGKIGLYMASHGLVPDRVLLSTALRCRQTWACAAAAFRPPPAAAASAALYNATPQALLAAVQEAPAAARTLLVLGHNPGLHELALLLIAAGDVDERERLREKLPTCGLVTIDFAFDDWAKLHPRCGRLERFVSPGTLEAAS